MYAESIEGYINREALEWLYEQASKHEFIVEIGSYLGRSTAALAEGTKGIVVTIDDGFGPRDVNISPSDRLSIVSRFRNNIQRFKNVVAINLDHEKLDSLKFHTSPDMIFLDGRHTYEAVMSDLNWALSCSSQILLCGDDIDNPAIQEALYNFLKPLGKETQIHHVLKTALWFVDLDS